MPYYRILNNLAMGEGHIPRGTIHRLRLSTGKINRLIEVGAISQVSTPPLAILPDWEERASRLKSLEIITIEDLFEALDDVPEQVAQLFETQVEVVLQWRIELERDWLTL